MDGFINVLKPPGMTSHDVVNSIRGLMKTKRVGHTGTLDPGAAGVLLVGCGRATRLIEYLQSEKKYRTEITFGMSSSTGDAFGEMEQRVIPEDFEQSRVVSVLPEFTGRIHQIPPMTSAVRHHGRKLYELDRKGIVVDRPARTVTIFRLELVQWFQEAKPRAIIDVWCSAGTYIRTLCHDIGKRLGCGAYMSFLLRTGVGTHTIAEAYTLEELHDLSLGDKLDGAVLDMAKSLSFMPQVEVGEGAVKSVCSGAILHPPGVMSVTGEILEDTLVALKSKGRVLGIARAVFGEQGVYRFKPEKIIATSF